MGSPPRQFHFTARRLALPAPTWCTPHPTGTTAEDRAHLVEYRYDDIASLEAAVDGTGSDLAAIVASGLNHDNGVDLEPPVAAFAQYVRVLCDAQGAALILDLA